MNEVLALRRGDLPTVRRQQMPTLSELVDEYVAQHTAETNTLRTLRERLKYATKQVRVTRASTASICSRWRVAQEPARAFRMGHP